MICAPSRCRLVDHVIVVSAIVGKVGHRNARAPGNARGSPPCTDPDPTDVVAVICATAWAVQLGGGRFFTDHDGLAEAIGDVFWFPRDAFVSDIEDTTSFHVGARSTFALPQLLAAISGVIDLAVSTRAGPSFSCI